MSLEAEKIIEGRVVQVKGADIIIANVGLNQGASNGDRFLIFSRGEEVFDPETGTSLGRLERVKGVFVVHHAQEKMSQLSRFVDAPKPILAGRVLSAVMAQTHGGGARVEPIMVGDSLRLLVQGTALEST